MNARQDLRAEDMAYVAVIETEEQGREKTGWYLGIAVRGEDGYHQLKRGYGPYASKEDADAHAKELNATLGHTPKEASMLILSTMFQGPSRKRRRRRS
jgi:hypothetical protein